MSPSPKKILIGVSGSISAYKVCEVISQLKKQGHDVKVIATRSALKFVGKASFEGLTGHAVLSDDFTDGAMMSHIHFAKWADVFVIAPATAQTLNALAQGAGGGILMSTYLAYDMTKPLIIAPAMNTQMLQHPTTQRALTALVSMGAAVLPTGSGNLACGDVGLGRLIEPADLIAAVTATLAPKKNFSILITAGGTKVPIDSVRSITNTSTGATGTYLADYLTSLNYPVDILLSSEAAHPRRAKNVFRFSTYDDLAKLMESKIRKNQYDLVIHAAAVSDFIVDAGKTSKLASGTEYTLKLIPTEKLIGKIKTWSKKSKVVGFKLTDTLKLTDRKKSVDKIFAQQADWVVQNDLSEISADRHVFSLFSPKGTATKVDGKQALAQAIGHIIGSLTPTLNKTNKPFSQKIKEIVQ